MIKKQKTELNNNKRNLFYLHLSKIKKTFMETMYDTLLQLPLFQGLCHNDFTEILEKVKIHFAKYQAGDTILTQGDVCDKLVFLLKGKISSNTISTDKVYTYIEYIEAPYLIEPHSLFGMEVAYNSTYMAEGEVNIISIDKPFVLEELSKYEIFRINYLNIISSRAQLYYKRTWESSVKNVAQQILDFIVMRSEKIMGEKLLKIRMEDFAEYIDETRLSVSKELRKFEEVGLLTIGRGTIQIFDLEKLVLWVEEHKDE